MKTLTYKDVNNIIAIVNDINCDIAKIYRNSAINAHNQLKVAILSSEDGYEISFNRDIFDLDRWAKTSAKNKKSDVFADIYDEVNMLLWIIYPEQFQL